MVGTEDLSTHDLDQLVRTDDRWAGRPIVLLSCETGQGESPVAQEVANQLGVVVTAPTEVAWHDPNEGDLHTSSERLNEHGEWETVVPPDGEWIDFQP